MSEERQEDVTWLRCGVGSCHRHQDCMYTPCRAPSVATPPLPPQHREPIEADREAGALESQAIFAETVDNGGWSLTLHFGKGDDARDRMRRVSDYLRGHRLAFSTPAASHVKGIIGGLLEAIKKGDRVHPAIGQARVYLSRATPSTEGRKGEDQADG